MTELMSLYEKYGGFAAVSLVVHDFYERVRESEELSPYFASVDMEHLIRHQIAFLCKVLGGPDNYEGRSLAAAHARLKITQRAFAEVAELLSASLLAAGVSEEDVATVLGVVASARPQIVHESALDAVAS